MKLSPFTLIYQSDLEPDERNVRLPSQKRRGTKSGGFAKGGGDISGKGKRRPPKSGPSAGGASPSGIRTRATKSKHSGVHLATIRRLAPDLTKSLKMLRPELSRTLLASSLAQESIGAKTATAARTLRPVLQDLQRGTTTVAVALWDLDARVGELPEIINLLNKSQPVFTFFDLQAPIPSGLVIQAEHFAAWARKRLAKRFSKKDQEDFQDNLMFDDFYKFARRVRKALGVDCLIGITKQMVAFESKGHLSWNYFSHASNRIVLASTYDVREYATRAGRPFEVAVAIVVIARLLKTFNPKVKYHEDRGCIFDFAKNRDLLKKIKAAQIEASCLKLIDAKYRGAAEAMMQALRDYSRSEEPEEQKETPPGVKQDDAYWLNKLKSLSRELSVESK
jgi:hypothetical protein